MRKEPLKDMIVADAFDDEDNVWLGLVSYDIIKTKDTNEFLKRYLINE